ncbi:MAG: hypothetical protein K0V04_20245, partial [Deltaproteobacteria bacterium]|nr:hypothetical protein [Deltaproteobacteria bacterium]
DAEIPSTKAGRPIVNAAIKGVRDSDSGDLSGLKLIKTAEFSLASLVAELGAIFRLDLIRAEKLRNLAQKHQDKLLDSGMAFQKMLIDDVYVGMKAADLREAKNYW